MPWLSPSAARHEPPHPVLGQLTRRLTLQGDDKSQPIVRAVSVVNQLPDWLPLLTTVLSEAVTLFLFTFCHVAV